MLIYTRVVTLTDTILRFPSLQAMIPSATFGFSWPASLTRAWFRPRCCLDDLPTDVLLDGVLHILAVQDILSVRMVNKRFYALTHHASIWKRLLRRLNLPVPPLPPTSRRSFAKITGLEAERLFVRSLSLSRNFSSRNPSPYWARAVEAFHHIQSMVILPGGSYLVASVREETCNSFALMVFVLDYRNGGALPLARAVTVTQAYNLQAKYMKVHGQNGIVIAYTIKDVRSKKYKMAAQGYASTTNLCLLLLTTFNLGSTYPISTPYHRSMRQFHSNISVLHFFVPSSFPKNSATQTSISLVRKNFSTTPEDSHPLSNFWQN